MENLSHRVFSGMRPSGRLHLGNYFGALQNWVVLQEDYECIYCAVDVHALTDMQGQASKEIRANIYEMILDWLAAGIDPQKSVEAINSSSGLVVLENEWIVISPHNITSKVFVTILYMYVFVSVEKTLEVNYYKLFFCFLFFV